MGSQNISFKSHDINQQMLIILEWVTSKTTSVLLVLLYFSAYFASLISKCGE